MNRSTLRAVAGAAGALLVAAIAPGCAPSEGAKEPEPTSAPHRLGGPAGAKPSAQTATATYVCMGTEGAVKLTASAGTDPGEVRITLVTSRFKAPVKLAEGAVDATLTLSNSGQGGARKAVFRGSNPKLAAGEVLRLGPLSGQASRGARLDSALADGGKGALRISYGMLVIDCRAQTAQKPGPFTY